MTGKQETERKQIRSADIEIAEYLLPGKKLTIEQKMIIFEITNGMIKMEIRFSIVFAVKEMICNMYIIDFFLTKTKVKLKTTV